MKRGQKRGKKDSVGLPFHIQLFGGFRKKDVMEYVEELVMDIEEERKELEAQQKNALSLLIKAQMMADKTIQEATERSYTIENEAEQKVEELLREKEERIQILNREHKQMKERLGSEVNAIMEILEPLQEILDLNRYEAEDEL